MEKSYVSFPLCRWKQQQQQRSKIIDRMWSYSPIYLFFMPPAICLWPAEIEWLNCVINIRTEGRKPSGADDRWSVYKTFVVYVRIIPSCLVTCNNELAWSWCVPVRKAWSVENNSVNRNWPAMTKRWCKSLERNRWLYLSLFLLKAMSNRVGITWNALSFFHLLIELSLSLCRRMKNEWKQSWSSQLVGWLFLSFF